MWTHQIKRSMYWARKVNGHVCVLRHRFCFSAVFLLNFGIVPTVVFFCFYYILKFYFIFWQDVRAAYILRVSLHVIHHISVSNYNMSVNFIYKTYIQFRAAKSLWTNLIPPRYSIPLATSSPYSTRSFTVGFCI